MTVDVCVIGGGIVGLATACRLLESRRELRVCVIEKESEPGRHQTGHNSGVIHSGIYYRPGSLKAQNCVRGYRLLLDFLRQEKVPFEICGKLIVATEPAELERLAVLEERGAQNGLSGIERLGPEQIREREPHCSGLQALWVPQTGIVDFRLVCRALLARFQRLGGQVSFGREVRAISERNEHVELVNDADTVVARYVINCAGLHSDRLARFADPALALRIVPFRGEYYRLLPAARHLVKNLIYPVPNPEFPFLGVHFTRTAWGDVDAGPNAVLALKREGYGRTDIHLRDLWETVTWPGFSRLVARHWQDGCQELVRSWFKSSFVRALQRLVPEVQSEHLEPAAAGVRAQACGRDGKLLDDFHLLRFSRQLHVCNAPSPAATSSLSIGMTVVEQVLPALS
ncbi:MAG TPA: L-2-hydroxyglutarate oxidase [Polyangiaceae bacterium]|nr:L-2-hydroxyglutarate oxidase [Polyangiaceae bacterium]